MNTSLSFWLNQPLLPKRSIFVSYHHKQDQSYYDELKRVASEKFQLFNDNSLNRVIDSDDTDYVIQRIRDNFITGTSCTIVLCGKETYQRKYVDWETKATLDKEHGLIAVQLPTLPVDANGRVTLPRRLNSNINSGYALWISWSALVNNLLDLKGFIEEAVQRSNNTFYKAKIINPKEIKKQNG